MKRLISWLKPSLTWLKWIDDNLINIFLSLFIFIIPLYPKLPFIDLEYTYISVRLEDIFIALFFFIFIIQVLRKKIVFRTKFLLLFVLFWIAVLLSFVVGFYMQKTIPIHQIGLLHSLRRVEYMFIFFIAASAVKSKQALFFFLKLYFIALLIVSLYGIGQRFFHLPAVQTTNPEFARGRIVYLTPEARVASTFGGHFDLSTYLAFSLPLLLGYFFFSHKLQLIGLFIISLITLLLTAQRIAFMAFAVTMFLFLIIAKKFKFLLLAGVAIIILIFTTGDLVTRFLQTFQIKKVFINKSTGTFIIDQKISIKELPAGNVKIPMELLNKVPILKKLVTEKLEALPVEDSQTRKKILDIARKQAIEEAEQQGKKVSAVEIENRAQQIASMFQVENILLCDISCSTRLQVEWPRAIAAFLYNPFFGTGPSSLTEATDNDFLRWLGELGLVGTLIFVYILFSITLFIKKVKKNLPEEEKYIYSGFLFGLLALLIIAINIDVFEASKVAYNFWLIAGIFVGYLYLYEKKEAK